MKKIINGKRYDTETAMAVGGNDNGLLPGDFDYICVCLYKKRNGEYFLFGEGGANTRYAVSIGQNNWSGGWKISPLDYEKAREWAEKNLSADEYEAEFGEVSEGDDGGTEVLSVSLPATLSDKLRKAAAKDGLPVSKKIAEMIESL